MDFKLERDVIRFIFSSPAVVRKSIGAWREWQQATREEAIPVVQVRDDGVLHQGVTIQMEKSEIDLGGII